MRRALSLLLVLVVVIFTAQNYEVIEIRFLAWSFTMSRAVVIFLSLFSGILIGWLAPLRGGTAAKSGEADRSPMREDD